MPNINLHTHSSNISAWILFGRLGNVDLVNRLLLDAGITSDLIKIWKENEPM